MRSAARLLRRIKQVFRIGETDAELADEMAFHREALEREFIAKGLAAADARDAARRAMGNETITREASRDVWLGRLEGIFQDARATMRGLAKSPAFTIGVTLTFALGIGANAAMFSLVDRLMLRPPALMRDAASVHRVYMYKLRDGVEQETGGQYARYVDLVGWTTQFSQTGAYVARDLAIGVGDEAHEARVGIVSASFFDFFDAPPAAGRYFRPAEDTLPYGTNVAVLSFGTWQSRFAGKQDALGQSLQIGSLVYTIIGVAPKDFAGIWPLKAPVAFIPISTYGASRNPNNWATSYTFAFGTEILVRRKPGVTLAEADADLTQAFTKSYTESWNRDARNAAPELVKPRAMAAPVLLERGPRRSGVATVAIWLGGVTVIVLLIACANVANLLLARAIARRREIALRIALGVSRSRLLAHLLVESTLLAIAGGVCGALIAVGLSRVLSAYYLPGTDSTAVLTDGRTMGFVAIVALGVGVLTGLVPLIQSRRLALRDDLAGGVRAGSFQGSVARPALLVLQAALSLVLLVGAGLFVRSARNAAAVRLGFDADKVLTVGTVMRGARLDSAARVELPLRMLAAAQSMPEVAHASLQEETPFSGGESSWPLFVDGIDSVEARGQFNLNFISADYFATMGTRILRGRAIDEGDGEKAAHVAVLGASMAAVLWPGQEAIGQCIHVGDRNAPCTSVVGVAEDIRSRSLGDEGRLYYYYLSAQQPLPRVLVRGLFVRTKGEPAAALEAVRKRLQREMPGASYVNVSRLSDNVDSGRRAWVMGATSFVAFGALALVLAAIGLYSSIAYNVAQRRQELAVRVALGAMMRDLVGHVVSGGLRVAGLGVLIGAAVAAGAAHWIEPLLFQESARDPAVFGAVIGVLLLVAIIASLVPAFRAARTDPKIALGEG